MKFVYLETYGCSANQNNTEIMKGKLAEAGLDFTDNPGIADILIINSCIVKGPTENKIKARISELEKLNKPIIIAGCMPQVRKLTGKNIFLLGINHIKNISKLIRRIQENNYNEKEFLSSKKEIKLNCQKVNNNKLVGITQISEGCLGDCNYCITKLVKGKLFSYPDSEILKNIKKDIKNGCKEIWITSQDCAAYGLDSDTNLPELLKKIIEIEGKFNIRLGMSNPNHILPIFKELAEIYKHEKMYKFLHVPVQSGSNKILKAMGREYTREDFFKIIKEFKKTQVTISTDIIVGYPGESEEDFQQTLDLIKKTQPDVMNISKYCAMRGTKAAELEQIDGKTSSTRASIVQQLHLKIAKENKQKYLSKIIEVFVNEQQGTNCLARDKNYQLVVIRTNKNILGRKLKVLVTEIQSHYLIGELV